MKLNTNPITPLQMSAEPETWPNTSKFYSNRKGKKSRILRRDVEISIIM